MNPYAPPAAKVEDAAVLPESEPVFFAVSGLKPVQRAVNAINRELAPAADANARFKGWKIFGLIAGGIVLALALTGAFVPE